MKKEIFCTNINKGEIHFSHGTNSLVLYLVISNLYVFFKLVDYNEGNALSQLILII